MEKTPSGNIEMTIVEVAGPPSCIPLGCEVITPQLLPLLHVGEQEIDILVRTVTGGALNVQDMYPLSPQQEGVVLDQRSRPETDAFLEHRIYSFDCAARVTRFLEVLQLVVDRHETLRTSVVSDDLPEPIQIVWRQAVLIPEYVKLDAECADILGALRAWSNRPCSRLDPTKAPLLKPYIVEDKSQGRWVMLLSHHPLCIDSYSMDCVEKEICAVLVGGPGTLRSPASLRPLVAEARKEGNQGTHTEFFRKLLGTVAEPTAPFGLLDAPLGRTRGTDSTWLVHSSLSDRMRAIARGLDVDVSVLWHLAFASVLSRVSGLHQVVFGTILQWRMQGEEQSPLGIFLNTLPIPIPVAEMSAVDCVRYTHSTLRQLQQHRHASLALAQECSGVARPIRLFGALFWYRKLTVANQWAPIHTLNGIDLIEQVDRPSYPFSVVIDDSPERCTITARVSDPLDSTRALEFIRTAIDSLVTTLEIAPDTAMWRVNVLPEAELHKTIVEWNVTTRDFPRHRCVHELFADQVARAPDAIAIEFAGHTATYGEIDSRSNQLAHHLIELGIRPDKPVAICMERGPELIVGLLAVLKAGGAYLPLDPSYPSARLAHILTDSAPGAILTQQRFTSTLPKSTVPVIAMDSGWSQIAATAGHAPNARVMGLTVHHLAYIIYTSGSTGEPKGVAVPHSVVVARIAAQSSLSVVLDTDRFCQQTSIGFVDSIAEILVPLVLGVPLLIAPERMSKNPGQLISFMHKHRVTYFLSVPSLADAMLDLAAGTMHSLRDLRVWELGGERLSGELVQRLSEQLPGCQFINAYGSSEVFYAASYKIERLPSAGASVPIGRPIYNSKIYILDSYLRPVPIGVVGEIYVEGEGLARGYLGSPNLTAARFIASPFGGAGARMFRTGDLGLYLGDGNIECLGRRDQQVKLRGSRIELGEIEARLAECSGVSHSVVVAREDGKVSSQLVAYLTLHNSATLSPMDLRKQLSLVLPDYMIPSAFVLLKQMPLTPTGKLDRNALPTPDQTSVAAPPYRSPAGEIERTIAEIWQELLMLERVGRDDNFFELGGHSLLAVRVLERMRRQGLSSDIPSLFSRPELGAFAATVEHRPHVLEARPNLIPDRTDVITPQMLTLIQLTQAQISLATSHVRGGTLNVQDIYPLSPLQEGILFHHLTAKKGDPYLLTKVVAFADRQRLDAYIAALAAVVARHDILRTAIAWDGLPEPVQIVWRKASPIVEELALEPAGGDIGQQLRAKYDPRHYRTDVREAPMVRLAVSYDPIHERWIAIQLMHHLVTDNAAAEAMQCEIEYHLQGGLDRLPRSFPYRNFIAETRARRGTQDHEAFFRKMLGEVDEPTAPFGIFGTSGKGSGVSQSVLELGASLSARVRERARAFGVTPANLFHVAWGQVVARTSGCSDPVFGTVLLGRSPSDDGVDRALGMYINTLPIRLKLGGVGAEQCVHATHETLTALMEHEHAQLVMAQRCSALPPQLPLFTTLLNYRHSAPPKDGIANGAIQSISGIEYLYNDERTHYPLALSVDDFDTQFGLTVQTVQEIAPARICAMMHRALESLVDALEIAPRTPMGCLEVLPRAERDLLLFEWNATEAPYPRFKCVQELIEAHATRNPTKTAVGFAGQTLSFSDLNFRANQLAHHLRLLGVGPDTRVAICAERSLELIVGLLAILKAGGAYVPLDPRYPAERISFMLRDSEPIVVLTYGAGRQTLDQTSVCCAEIPRLDLALDALEWAQHSNANLDPVGLGLTSSNLAYVMYTSGSTGTPKGVMVEHRNLVNLVTAYHASARLTGEDRVLQFASFSFDASVGEIFSALSIGSTLILRPESLISADESFVRFLDMEHISHCDLPTAFWHQWVAEISRGRCSAPTSLRFVFVGGEKPDKEHLARWLAEPNLRSCRWANGYGPTEATVYVTAIGYDGGCERTLCEIPIGRPILNSRIYVLDTFGQPVPIGVLGEIHIGGAGVARGYLNRRAMTEHAFIEDPFVPGERLYRTGDLGRYLPDGNLEFLGRNDTQVKIRGFRVELAEIEASIAKCSGVAESVVLVLDDETGNKRLVAYIRKRAGSDTTMSELRSALSRVLPDYMVPHAIVFLPAIPLTPNGKLDRNALPVPDKSALHTRHHEPPVGELEATLARVWETIFRIDGIGRHDNFFELGGHSLLITQMISRVNEALDISIAFSVAFECTTIATLAARLIADNARISPPIDPR
jgi:amino acid adenylation domain-containing protein